MLTRPAPDARTLYLGTRSKKQVSCTAEALVVQNPARQTMRYPLSRIARVVSSTNTDWSGAALALCLEAGIGITWMSARGSPLGTCYPHLHRYPKAAVALEMLTESPAGMERYTAWLRQRRMAVLVRWGEACAGNITPVIWETTKREWVYGARVQTLLPHTLHSHCLAYVGAQLSLHGLQATLFGPEARPIAFDHDLANLLWGEMNLLLGSLAAESVAEQSTAALFEHWLGANAAALENHIHSVERIALKALYQP